MAIQSTGGVNDAQSLFPTLNARAARTALASVISARVDLSKNPIRGTSPGAVNGLNVQRASLAVQAASATDTKAVIDSLGGVFETAEDLITQLNDLAAQAHVAAPGDKPALQASAELLVQGLRNTIGGFNSTFPSARIITRAPTGTAPNHAVVDLVDIYSVNGEIPEDGIDITVDVEFNADPNVQGTGRRAQTNVVNTSAGVLLGDINFQLQGPSGSAAFNFLTGTTRDAIVDAINDESDTLGLVAEASGNAVRVFSLDFGSDQFIDITEVQDHAFNHVISQPTATGFDSYAEITINGSTAGFVGDGRLIEFDVGGVTGRVKLFPLFNSAVGLGEALDRAPVTARIEGGGLYTPSLGSTTVGFSELNFNSIGASRGGLASIDLVNDSVTAQHIIDEAGDDIAAALNRSNTISNALGNAITTTSDQIANIDSTIEETLAVTNGLSLFNTISAEADFQAANALFSQTISLFPVAASRLL